MKKIRYAVVGLGHIAQVAVLPAFKHAKKNSQLAAVVSGTPKKRKLLSKKYKLESAYSYEEFLSREECAEMVRASQSSGAKLMTAYRLHFDKPTADAIKLCQNGKLGKLKTYTSTFSYVIQDMHNIRLRPDDGGGPLWDIGIYCINATRYLFGENPIEAFAYGARLPTGPFSKVEESVTAVLRFSEDRTAMFSCSFNATESSYFEVYGDKGKLRLENAFEYAHPPELRTFFKGKQTKKRYKKVDQFAAELDYFSNCILNNRSIEPSGEEGFTDVAIIEAINQSIETGKAVAINYGGLEKIARPKPKMVETNPPNRKPELVEVKSASGD